MLSVYTRHSSFCSRNDIHYRRCHCPKWIQGTLEERQYFRISAKTRNWHAAERKAHAMEGAAQQQPITVTAAIQAFIADQSARKLLADSIKRSRLLLEKEFGAWCERKGLVFLEDIRPAEIREFRTTWCNTSKSAHRKHERMKGFFGFSVSNGWLQKNPMDGVTKPRIPDVIPTNYFTRDEFQQILNATYRYDYGGGNDCHHRAQRLRALVLLMRWSGLAIKDAVTLERNRLNDDGSIFLRRAKTGVPVYVPLPPRVASTLRLLPPTDKPWFFWSGNGDANSAVKAYQRSFWKLFQLADIKNPDGRPKRCHSHMLRDTLAVELLLAGVPIDQVSVLLGHRSVKMTEKHYLPWVKARQDQLAWSVQRAWFPELMSSPNTHSSCRFPLRPEKVDEWIGRSWVKACEMETGRGKRLVIDAEEFCEFCRKHTRDAVGNRLSKEGWVLFITSRFHPAMANCHRYGTCAVYCRYAQSALRSSTPPHQILVVLSR